MKKKLLFLMSDYQIFYKVMFLGLLNYRTSEFLPIWFSKFNPFA